MGPLKVVVIDPENSVIALIKEAANSLQICELRSLSTRPHLRTLCHLRLPLRSKRASVVKVEREWIGTSTPRKRGDSQTSLGQPFPFRSHRAGTIALILEQKSKKLKGGTAAKQCAMFVSVGALIAHAHADSGVTNVPWVDWGPAATRVVPLGKGSLPTPAGPFWITNYAHLVVRDYDLFRAGYMEKKKTSTTSIRSGPSPGPRSTKLFGRHWAEGKIETRLPFRKFVAKGLSFKRVVQVVADREWVVVVSRTVSGSCLHSWEKLTTSIYADRERGRELLSTFTM